MWLRRGEGKGAQPAMMLLSVLMVPSRCLTLCEQMGLLCVSAFPACCIVYQPCQHASVLMCLFTGPSGRRPGVGSCYIVLLFLLAQQLLLSRVSISARIKNGSAYVCVHRWRWKLRS